MPNAQELVERAFDKLTQVSGFAERPNQRQLSLLLADLIDGGQYGLFEAPTGLGKSLASLIPAIAHAIVSKKRTVIATYTNVLAEQYWHKDLPFALSLFEDTGEVKTAFLVGRQRYACLEAMEDVAPDKRELFQRRAELGIESEFRSIIKMTSREKSDLWSKVVVPPVCQARLCPTYDKCYYYGARKKAQSAHIIITNHSMVMSDALASKVGEGEEGLIGNYDYLILDEAHDFPGAAANGLEFELNGSRLAMALGLGIRLEKLLEPALNLVPEYRRIFVKFKERIEYCQRELNGVGIAVGRSGILSVSPADISESPAVKQATITGATENIAKFSEHVVHSCRGITEGVGQLLTATRELSPETAKQCSEVSRNFLSYLTEIGLGAQAVIEPNGISVSHLRTGAETSLRQDIIGVSEPLTEILWEKKPTTCLSATLALDGKFEYFRESCGAKADFEEILESPFDFARQATLYLPPMGRIPDPATARRENLEPSYFQALAEELTKIIEACQGRTLALFHSRREMDEVYSRMNLMDDLPIVTQGKMGAQTVGEQFKRNVSTSLFGLRSFWTGFDAPGETLTCVVLVRIPFEVPIEPPQLTRMAWLQSQGHDPFQAHSLPQAKMIIRQGAGRLIRSITDKGVIAILDPRVQTKPYGEQILDNLPVGMSRYNDIYEALAGVGVS